MRYLKSLAIAMSGSVFAAAVAVGTAPANAAHGKFDPDPDPVTAVATGGGGGGGDGGPEAQGEKTSEAMLAYLRALAAQGEFTGSALVVRHGQVLARFAAGEADEARHIPNRPNTVYLTASVTKQFTSMIILKLRDR